MSRQARNSWFLLSPPFPEKGEACCLFREHARRLSEWLDAEGISPDDERQILRTALTLAREQECSSALIAALGVLSDLARQRWSIRVNNDGQVEVKRPDDERLDPTRQKARIRAQELVKRNEQLREPATRKFVTSMERRSVHDGRFVSIFSLIRDGRELSQSLRSVRSLPDDVRLGALKDVIDPYLQFVDEAALCPHTRRRHQVSMI